MRHALQVLKPIGFPPFLSALLLAFSLATAAADTKDTVDEVLEGDWDKPTITVFHWMIMDSKRLPIADRPPGTKVELTVEPFTSHPQLQTSRRDELIDTDFSAVLFYCEPAEAPAP